MSIDATPDRASLAHFAWVVASVGVACVPEQPRAEDVATIRALELRDAVEAERSDWPRLPEPWGERTRGSGAHGRSVEIFASPEVTGVLDADETRTSWPDRSRFVIEGYADEGASSPYVVGIMIKERGTWRWAQYEDEDPVVHGRPSSCIGCHLAGDDLVRSVSLPVQEE
jgi:hypothetical protein